jgi:hypothetical protein
MDFEQKNEQYKKKRMTFPLQSVITELWMSPSSLFYLIIKIKIKFLIY